MSHQARHCRISVRAAVLVAFTALASVTGVTLAQAQEPLPVNKCTGSVDTYHFSTQGGGGLRPLPLDAKFTGDGQQKGICGPGPDGAKNIKLERAAGSGLLSCTVSTNVDGKMTLGWYRDDETKTANSTVDIGSFEFTDFDFGGGNVSKAIIVTGMVESGSYQGTHFKVIYNSNADTTLCGSPSGLQEAAGTAHSMTFTPVA